MTPSLSLIGIALTTLTGCSQKTPNPASDPFHVYEDLAELNPDKCFFSETNTKYGGALGEPRYHRGEFTCKGLNVFAGDAVLTDFTLIDERNYRYEHLTGKGSTGSTYLIRAFYEFSDDSSVTQFRSANISNSNGLTQGTFGRSGNVVSEKTLNWDFSESDTVEGGFATSAEARLRSLWEYLSAR